MGLEDGVRNQGRDYSPREKLAGSTPLGVLKEEVAGASSGLKQPPCVKMSYEETNVIPIPVSQDRDSATQPGLRDGRSWL